ncbi:hypothetical protein [Actinokineospora sp.]|uniref:hypothetical protein n=1 Tax=Actinokineospora sp. TaxID=1872133 RepID=UPI0040384F2F
MPSDLEPPADRRRPWALISVAIALLGLGATVAWGVGAALGVSFRPADVPGEQLTAAQAATVAAVPAVTDIIVPADKRITLAAAAVAAAVAGRGAPRPAVGQEPAVRRGPVLRVSLVSAFSDSAEAFRLGRDGADLVLRAATPGGAAAGLYTVADRVRSGTEVLPPGDVDRVQAPRLGLRLTDMGAVGISADPATFAAGTDYSLNSSALRGAILPDAPYVDAGAVEEISRHFRQFVDHSLAEGYNGITVPGFLEYVTFGDEVYPAGDPHRARAEAMLTRFGPVWQYAHDMGMRVYFSTDMLATSPPLRQYLERTVGGLRVEEPRFWRVYQAGLSEFFTKLPYVAGLMIRIGEGGDVYKMPGQDFSSEIAVTSAASVRAMLTAFLEVAGGAGKDIIFRTWSVGVGAVGDLHTNPESYRQVLGGLDDPHLIVSTKYTLGDFYSYLPFNTTLAVGDQRRIVEFQARREFEGFGALPNDLGGLHGQALRTFLAANPHIEGVWNWTQEGGPLRAGPRTLHLRAGFWQLADLNTYTTARLAWNPDLDAAQATADWARQTFSYDPATVDAIARTMALSREAITKGLYIGPYANRSVKALGLEPPPMLWIFEWDIITGDSAALGAVYTVSKNQIGAAITEGDEAVAVARRMRALIGDTDPATWRDPALRANFVAALDFEVSLFETLGAYRTMVLRHAEWLDTGSASADDASAVARTRYEAARDRHVQRHGGDIDLPAYNFTAADIGLARADRDQTMAWLARALLVALLAAFALGSARGQRLLRGGTLPGAAALRALWVGATRPWRIGTLDVTPTAVDRVLVWAVPASALVLSRSIFTWFAAPAHLALVLGAWVIFAGTLRLLVRSADPFWLWAAVGGAILVRTVVLLLALATRGPGLYWLDFWTEPGVRAFYITVAFAAFLWVFVVAGMVLRDRYGLLRRRAVGRVLVALGMPLVVLGGVVSVLGLERALTIWNDQMALLPWGLSRILGITVHIGIPTSLPMVAAVAGVLVAVAGSVLAWVRGRAERKMITSPAQARRS